MELINNRYRIMSLLDNESYLVEDLLNNSEKQILKIIDYEKNSNIISYFIENFVEFEQIRHKNLLKSYEFDTIETINLKNTSTRLFFTTSEVIDAKTLFEVSESLDFNEKLMIILDLMSVMDFIHFRGFVYKYLNPEHIYYSHETGVKILNISSIVGKIISLQYNENTENFIAPEVIMNLNVNNKRSDYYSIGMIMKYLLCTDDLEYKEPEGLGINGEEKSVLVSIIENLINLDVNQRSIPLRDHIDKIVHAFNLDYKYDLKEERESIYLKTKIIGRDNEIEKILKIDSNITCNINTLLGLKIKGYIGSGKSRFLDEIIYRLRMMGREVHKIDLIPNDIMGVNNIANFLKQITENSKKEYLDKYKEDFSKLLPDLYDNSTSKYIDFGKINEKYRLFNRISNYLNDIAKYEAVYLFIDGFEKSNDIFVSFIDYLLKYSKLNKVFFIIAYNEGMISNDILDKLNHWEEKGVLDSLSLENLSEECTGLLVKSILGMSYVPKNFSQILYKISKGNPGYIDFIINDLFNREELYITNDGYWDIKSKDYSQINFPSNYFNAIKGQLIRLDDDSLNVLNIISVFNTILSKKVLLKMTELYPPRLDEIIGNLINDRIIEQHNVEWGYNYNFSREELKRYLYWNLSDTEKLILHKKASDVILQIYGDRINIIMDELVYHLVNSNKSNLALDLIIDEAEKIDNKYNLNAIVLWEKAYLIVEADDIENRLKILDILTDIFLFKGNTEKLNLYLNELFNLSISANSIEYIIKSRNYRIELFFRTNQLDELEKEIEALEGLSRENNIPKGIIFSLVAKCRMCLNQNNIIEIERMMDEAIELSQKYGIVSYLGNIYLTLGNMEYLRGNTEGAIKYFIESRDCFDEDNNMYEIVKPINNLGVIYCEIYGDIDKGLSYYKQGLKLASIYGFSQLETTFLNNIGELYFNSLDYNRALDYILNSRRMAIEINDYKLTFLAYINLGYIDLIANKFDKAYNCYSFLNNLYKANAILDEETLCQYYNFLGEFYYIFGKYNQALEYSKKSSDISKNFNVKEHLRAESRILFVEYITNGYIDKKEIDYINSKYLEAGIVYENLKNILHLCKLSLLNRDVDLAYFLLTKYHVLSKDINNEYLNVMCKLIELMLEGTKQSYHGIDDILLSLNSIEFLNDDIDLKYFLSMSYLNICDYIKALSKLLNTFDTLYKCVKGIDDFELQSSLINAKNGDKIKESIINIVELIYKKKIEYTPLSEVSQDNIDVYFDFSQIIDSIDNNKLYELVNNNDGNIKIKSVDDLLLNLNGDCQNNLHLILKYICQETLAKRGYIIIAGENDNHEIISNNADDVSLPKEVFLMQVLRNREPLLINRKTRDLNKKYVGFLPKDLIAVICVPIIIFDYDDIKFNKRKQESLQDSDVSGYIYLETTSALNQFDDKRCRLIRSLTNLIYLNIENEKLKLMSTTDKLTNLYTRKHLEYKFDNLLNTSKHLGNVFSVLMIDIDKFKDINDNYGHIKGDEVLYHIGRTIKNSIRSTDIVGRYGGEEIIVILLNISVENAIEIAEKIRANIETLEIPGVLHPITVSIGISQYPNHGHFKEELINKADQALYYAKEILSRNSVVFWNDGMEKVFSKTDKIYGIITGNTIIDTRNVLAIIETSELILNNEYSRKKYYEFLGKLLNIVEGEYASLILLEEDKIVTTLTRKRHTSDWVESYKINSHLIDKVIDSRKGEFLIDWETMEDIDKVSGNPNWQSTIVLPLIKNDITLGVIYITVPLKEKEFSLNNFNLASVLGNIFTSNL